MTCIAQAITKCKYEAADQKQKTEHQIDIAGESVKYLQTFLGFLQKKKRNGNLV